MTWEFYERHLWYTAIPELWEYSDDTNFGSMVLPCSSPFFALVSGSELSQPIKWVELTHFKPFSPTRSETLWLIFVRIFERSSYREPPGTFSELKIKMTRRMRVLTKINWKDLQKHEKGFMIRFERRWWPFWTSSSLKILLLLREICIPERSQRLKTFLIIAFNFRRVFLSTLY